MNVAELLSQGLAHHQGGRLPEAEAVYRRILAAAPRHADALHLLGVLAHQSGHHAAAAELVGAAIQSEGGRAPFHNNLGLILLALGRAADAARAWRKAAVLQPGYADPYSHLASDAGRRETWEASLKHATRGVALAPDRGEPYKLVATAYRGTGKLPRAWRSYRRLLALMPDAGDAFADLAIAGVSVFKAHRVEALLRRALAAMPHLAEARVNLAGVSVELGRASEAIRFAAAGIVLSPAQSQAHNNLGLAFRALGDATSATISFRRALAIAPAEALTVMNLGLALGSTGRLTDAVAKLRQSAALAPGLASTHNNLATELQRAGDLVAMRRSYDRSVVCDPDIAGWQSNRIFSLLYEPSVSGTAVVAASRRWASRFPVPPRPRPSRPVKDRKLRVGYVSPDFREHALERFVEPLLAAHDRSSLEVFCYAEVARSDAATERYRRLSDGWRSTVGLVDTDVAAMVRRDEVDILVDLASHTAGNRLGVFALRPAPVQVGLNVVTTGLNAVDWFIGDPWLNPPGSEAQYTERLLRLDRCAWCYAPVPDAPAVVPRPSGRPIVFGSANNLTKVTDPALELWSKVLDAVPEGRLVIKAPALTDDGVRRLMHRRLDRFGLGGRTELRGPTRGLAEHLAAYAEFDIALDPFPFNGHTTTAEAMWMGIPVVTLAGRPDVAPASARVGVSFLNAVGLGDLVASDEAAYVSIAASLARDPDRLAGLRAGLRGRMASSSLCDAPGFARAIEGAYRSMWLDALSA